MAAAAPLLGPVGTLTVTVVEARNLGTDQTPGRPCTPRHARAC
jgi:hypothetical protein